MAGEFPAISEMAACGGASSLAGDATEVWALALSVINSLNRIRILSEASLGGISMKWELENGAQRPAPPPPQGLKCQKSPIRDWGEPA